MRDPTQVHQVSGSLSLKAYHAAPVGKSCAVLMCSLRIGLDHEQVVPGEVEICEGEKTSCESTTVAVSSTETLNACEDSVRPTACRQESMKQEISIIVILSQMTKSYGTVNPSEHNAIPFHFFLQ